MTLGVVLRAVNALLGGWLIISILSVVVHEHRVGNRDRGQYLRFTGLGMYAMNSALAIADLRNLPVTWHTWVSGLSAVVSAVGVLHIKRKQARL